MPHKKSKQIVIKFFEELDDYVCDSYSRVVQELYNLARDWKFNPPLVDGHGNFGIPSEPDNMSKNYHEEDAADPNYSEVRLSLAGIDYIKRHSIDTLTKYELLNKHKIFKP